ncbi:hypothetical protein [Actinomycetospora soli]|uniref:hypothetical protein n=1 Tax=Actinomycetospora soli TaxID=2893887 RepID=UPI001E38D189|nr:hypothetical protein [Actinomycetospora soli]MCD2191287.1 hypothetical protein [Actinomycetospora soli]
MRFFLSTGLRVGEALATRRLDLNLDGVPVRTAIGPVRRFHPRRRASRRAAQDEGQCTLHVGPMRQHPADVGVFDQGNLR